MRQETHQLLQNQHCGRNYPLPFTLLIKVERADVDPGVQLHQAVLTPYQHHLSRRVFDRGIKITFRVVEHRLAFFTGAGAGAATAGAAVLPTVTELERKNQIVVLPTRWSWSSFHFQFQ